MSYSIFLKKAIDDAGLSYKEVSDKCKTNGKPVDPSYISKLVNNKIAPPKDEVSTALAEACNIDPQLLIIEAYLENAPDSIKAMFKKLKEYFININAQLMPNIDKNELVKAYDLIPLSALVDGITNFSEDENIKTKVSLSDLEFIASDDGMNPMIPQGASAFLKQKKEYSDGDVVAISLIEDKKIIFRKYYSTPNSQAILTALNPTYSPIIVDTFKLAILGEVISVNIKD